MSGFEEALARLPEGLRQPGEFEEQEAVWFTWPSAQTTWPEDLGRVEAVLAAFVSRVAEDQTVRIHVQDEPHRNAVAAVFQAASGALPETVELIVQPSNDAWCRDHGALFVKDGAGRRLALDFRFNAWGGKYPPWDLDDRIGAAMADSAGAELITLPLVLEGGAVESNGQGWLLTTERCVLSRKRNRTGDQAAWENLFARAFGARHVVWLDGDLPGDDTDGHIDNLARFVSPFSIVACAPPPGNTAFGDMAGNPARLERAGWQGDLHTLPLPMRFIEANLLPASYANFLVTNSCVGVPVYGDPQDDIACARLETLFPGRRIEPVDCSDVIVGLGALHCLSQPLPV